jgi:hypothetical protein
MTVFRPNNKAPLYPAVRILTDSSRSNRYGLSTNNSFMSTIWYPADPRDANGVPGAYTDKAVAGDWAFYIYWGWAFGSDLSKLFWDSRVGDLEWAPEGLASDFEGVKTGAKACLAASLSI